ncbi:DUF1641 domain-containing protein [Silvibacterium acidisoli]|uniref:DUF1641 domain-containing protein n=1 Tax=Acidobacteriaceae bacterium ZG23-2 TaxID=2883246 RepID=UPI00406BEE3A
MAKPIAFEAPKRDVRDELKARLEAAPLEHAEAILAGLEVLQGLQDKGVLDVLRGALGAGENILEIIVAAAKSPEAIQGLRTLMILAKLIGTIDPDQLKAAIEGKGNEDPSLWSITKQARSKDGLRGMATAVGLLGVFGAGLNRQKAKQDAGQ